MQHPARSSHPTSRGHLIQSFRRRTFVHVRPTKIQISLHIHAIWSESSLGAFWLAKGAKFLYADNEDSDQTAQMRRLIWVFVGRICQTVLFLALWRTFIPVSTQRGKYIVAMWYVTAPLCNVASCVFVSFSGTVSINYLWHCTTDQKLLSQGVCLETLTPPSRQFPLFNDISKEHFIDQSWCDFIHLVDVSPFCTRKTTFVTSALLFCTPVVFWKGVYSKRKEFALTGSKFFPFKVYPFSEGENQFWQSCLPLKYIHSP